MKIKSSEIQKAIDWFKKHGDAQELNIEVDHNLHSRITLTGDAQGETVVIAIYAAELSVFPKITKTERL